jgi:hypothetical protein
MANHRTSPASKRNIKPLPLSASSPAQLQLGRSSGLSNTLSSSGPFGALQTTDPRLFSPNPSSAVNPRKRRASGQHLAPALQHGQSALAPALGPKQSLSTPGYGDNMTINPQGGLSNMAAPPIPATPPSSLQQGGGGPPTKKGRTNTPWTPGEEHRLKQMRDTGSSWSEIAKTFPNRTEGSVKKHWYKVRRFLLIYILSRRRRPFSFFALARMSSAFCQPLQLANSAFSFRTCTTLNSPKTRPPHCKPR